MGGRVPGGDLEAWPVSEARVGRGDGDRVRGAVGSRNRLWLTPYEPRRGSYGG